MSRLAEARATLAALFEPVLPGRVGPYPPMKAAAEAAPRIWVGDPMVTRENTGERSRMIVATFPVWVIVDGADRTQRAMLDDIVSGVWDAAEAAQLCDPRLVVNRAIPGEDRHRTVTVDVAVTITARTLCTPTVAEATIPPQPLEV